MSRTNTAAVVDRPAFLLIDTASHATTAEPTVVTQANADLRAGDADRDRVGTVLSEAVAAGYLTMEEFDERSDRLVRARTFGELGALQADLPVARVAAAPALRSEDADLDSARRGLRAHLISYASTMALLIGIWLVAGVSVGVWYFWPIWPLLGWGIGVASHALPVLSHGRRGIAAQPSH